ncbi:class I SAM-dependent methyltransferase [Campylobacter sputorum]|uniref:class I SAM-dependent methyltransferase n=1 Tax=Campylobacter sputorum TaxID=206 RepID=UPI00053BE3DC|nr:class I SAM-dependent methyltransferase [Campylobacter sputorum]
MDKLNQELTENMRKTFKIDELVNKFQDDYKLTDEIENLLGEIPPNQILSRLKEQKNYLRDKVHLYLDSPAYDTQELENNIINDCWQKAYSHFVPNIGYDFFKNYMSQFMPKAIKKYCKNLDHALEIGCGDGVVTKIISKHFKHTTGCDLSENSINLAKKNNHSSNISYICKSALELGKEQKYDFVFSSDILMYSIPNKIKSTFDELTSVLNGGGDFANA